MKLMILRLNLILTVVQLNFNGDEADSLNLQASFRSMTLPMLPSIAGTDFLTDIISTWHSITQPFMSSQYEAIGTIAFQPLPNLIGKASQANGGNAYGLTADDGPRFIIEQNYVWPSANDANTVYNISTEVTNAINASLPTYVAEAQAQTTNASIETYLPLFVNDANFAQDVFASWNYVDTMRSINLQLDPTGTYSNRIGGFHVQESSS